MSTYFSTESTNAEEVARALRTNNKDEKVGLVILVSSRASEYYMSNIFWQIYLIKDMQNIFYLYNILQKYISYILTYMLHIYIFPCRVS